MVQKVILIGLIGLLIALSNASDKESVPILTIEDKNYVTFKRAWNATETQNTTCPKDYEFYCKSQQYAPICVKGKDLEGKLIKIHDLGVYQCEKAQNLIDVTPRGGNPAEIKKDVEAYEAAYDYDQKPFYKKPQKMLFIFVLLAIAASACYWFLCCDKDDEDEEKDQNKAADP